MMKNTMHNIDPLVSVIIPTYSRPTNLVRAIESVINQSYKNIEIIVVDDNGEGSDMQKLTEQTILIYIREGKIKYIKHPFNKNASAARNTGLSVSSGKYINFMDDDDVLSNDKILRQVECLENSYEYDASYCDTEYIRRGGGKKVVNNPNETHSVEPILSGKSFFNTTTVLFKKSAIERLSGFDERFRRQQDYELYIRFFRSMKMIKAKSVYVVKYETENVVTQNPFKAQEYHQFFLDSFQDDIDSMSSKNEIYMDQYNTRLTWFLKCGNYKEAFKIYKKLWKYGCPSIVMHLKYFYHFMNNSVRPLRRNKN